MRLIDADPLIESLHESLSELYIILDELTDDIAIEICETQIITLTKCLLKIKEAPTIESEVKKDDKVR